MYVAVKTDSLDNRSSSESDTEIYDSLTINKNREEKLQNAQDDGEMEKQIKVSKCKLGSGLIAQAMLTAVATIGTAAAGMPIGYSAILLPQLKSMNGSLQIDEEMGSWIASIHSAATPVGALLSGTLMDFLGRKLTLQISCLPLICGWLAIGLAQEHAMLLTGRVMAGIAVGLVAAPTQVYIAEISDPNSRGVLSAIPFASYAFGILLVYILGSTAHWRTVAGFSIILPIVTAIMYFFLPESPVWLVRKNNIEGAKKACIWLRGGNKVQAKQEIHRLISRTENEKLQQETHYKSRWSSLFAPQVLKPFIIVNIFNFLQILSGVYLLVFYAVEIISNIGGENVNEFLVAVLTAGVRFLFTVLASIILGFAGRRAIGLCSALGTAISSICLAMFLYSECLTNVYFAGVCLLFYVAANTLGLMTLTGVLIGEMFPTRVRGLAGSLTFTLFHITIFATTKLFPLLKNTFGMRGFFIMFAISSLAASLFIYCAVPETKGKSLSEIEDYFLQENVLWITRNKKNINDIDECKNSKLQIAN